MSANTNEQPSSSSTLTPQWQRTRSSPRFREKQVMFEVFDNPWLWEEILNHVIIGSNKKVDLRAASTLRLVQKSWDQSVLGILWKLRESLFEVDAGSESGGNLDDSIKTFTVSTCTTNRALPPPLKLHFSFDRDGRELQQLLTFLTKCGPALFQMEIEIDEEGATPRWTPRSPWASLSRLHKLKVTLSLGPGVWMTIGDRDQKQGTSADEFKMDRLIESILRGATALAELDLSIFDNSYPGPPAYVTFIESLTFPPTLTTIKLNTNLDEPLAAVLLDALVNSPLPNLTSISLTNSLDIFPNDLLLFSILDKWKSSLKALAISGNSELPEIVCPIRLPVMEQLEEFYLTVITAVMVPGLDSLEICLPKLRTLRLCYVSPGLLRQWTTFSVFPGVTHLELLLADEDSVDVEDETDENLVSVNAEAMQLVNAAFPNLRKLRVGTSSSDPSGIKYVFMEMRQLEELKLHVFGDLYSPSGDEEETDPWDPILTGLSAEMLASPAVRGDPDWLVENGEILVSITNLQELKHLSVKDSRSYTIRNNDKYGSTPSLISDAVFEHAYLKMPKLTHLSFEGTFSASEEMSDKWKGDQRRSLICLPPFSGMD